MQRVLAERIIATEAEKRRAHWSDVYACLVPRRIRRRRRIGRYTERQILLFYDAEHRRRRRERAENFIDLNYAGASAKDAGEHYKLLSK